jgi:hypothetical protein
MTRGRSPKVLTSGRRPWVDLDHFRALGDRNAIPREAPDHTADGRDQTHVADPSNRVRGPN